MDMFIKINDKVIRDLILNANDSVIYVAPGINSIVSEGIVNVLKKISNENIEIIIDSNPEIFRIGYGEILAMDQLINNNISIKKVDLLRLGILIVDGNAIVYSPTPLIVEADNSKGMNAIRVTNEQAETLLKEIKAKTSQSGLNKTFQTSLLEVDAPFSPHTYTKIDLDKSTEDLEARPVKKFDLERRVQVYKSYFQFVDLSLIGINFSRRTVTIPSNLIAVSGDRDVQEKLKTTYKLINEKGKISGKEIEEEVAGLRKMYIRSMGKRLGSIILVSNKDEFISKVEKIKTEIQVFSETVREKLQDELNNTKKDICEILLPGIIENPPDDLRGGIATTKPSIEMATKYIENEIDKLLPKLDGFISEMKLHCDFKDVTYEMLNDKDFQKNLLKQFPYFESTYPYENFEAIGLKL